MPRGIRTARPRSRRTRWRGTCRSRTRWRGTRARRSGARGDAGRPQVHWGRVLFCVKEAVLKAWYLLAGTELGFLEAELTSRTDNGNGSSGTVTARLRRPGPFTAARGRWRVADGVVAAAIVARPTASRASGGRTRPTAPPEARPAA
ncbi:4'-phosphopantetheinyl transferase superfamily protein [Streptomyces sp. NPDC058195]|uniref:4'-phosphopantetheinyl transferase superfamily protein n=1 Tax=Streptomyces sp. NPDC058195 TaxID=3346375 RepID=UPI0036ECB3BB